MLVFQSMALLFRKEQEQRGMMLLPGDMPAPQTSSVLILSKNVRLPLLIVKLEKSPLLELAEVRLQQEKLLWPLLAIPPDYGN